MNRSSLCPERRLLGRNPVPDLTPNGTKRTSTRRSTAIRKPAVLSASFADVEPKSVQWLWPGWIPLGKLTVFDGEPGVGKSTITLDWAGAVSRRGTFPDGSRSGVRPSSVLMVGIEDDPADTIRPRLDANGADVSLVRYLKQEVDENGVPVPFVIPDDVDRLRDAIKEVRAKLVVIDPLAAFMSDRVKDGSDKSNRQALMYLAEIARKTNCAVVLVRHLNKNAGASAKNRGGGSVAIGALARSVIVAGRNPSNDSGSQFVLASTKANIAQQPSSVGYWIASSQDNPDASVVEWGDSVDLSADQVVGADGARPDGRRQAPEREEATRVLLDLLSDGPRPAKEVMAEVREITGVSEKTVNAARRAAGIETKPVRGERGQPDHWEWVLPTRMRAGSYPFSSSTN